MTPGFTPFTEWRLPRPRTKSTVFLSAISAAWLWVAWVQPLREGRSRAALEGAAARTAALRASSRQAGLGSLQDRILDIRTRLQSDRRTLWPPDRARSAVSAVEQLSTSSGIQMRSMAATSQVRQGVQVGSLRCELSGSFSRVLAFLRRLGEHSPLLHAKHLALDVAPGDPTPTVRLVATLEVFTLPGETF